MPNVSSLNNHAQPRKCESRPHVPGGVSHAIDQPVYRVIPGTRRVDAKSIGIDKSAQPTGWHVELRAQSQGRSTRRRKSSSPDWGLQVGRNIAFPFSLQMLLSGESSMRRVLSGEKDVSPLGLVNKVSERTFKKSSL